MADHGSRQRYADGCRCQDCKTAQSVYMREWKARRAGADIAAPKNGRPKKGATVTALPSVGAASVVQCGPKEAEVRAELATLTSAETHRGAAVAAIALAQILDNPQAINQHVAAAKALPGILTDLRKGTSKRHSRLASVSALTSVRSANGA